MTASALEPPPWGERVSYDLASVPERLRGERSDRAALVKRRLAFGVRFLDDALGGILPHDLVMLGAKTGAGKTQLATVIAQKNTSAGRRVVYLALEAEPREIERRMKYRTLARLFYKAGGKEVLSYRAWYMGEVDELLGPFELEADALLGRDFKSMRTLYRGRNFGIEDIGRVMRGLEKDGADLVIVDHLHYIDAPSDENENRAQKAIVQCIRDASLSTGIPVLVVAHLRKSERGSRRLVPELEDFHGSSDITKVATKAIMLAPVPEQPGFGGYSWGTYMTCPKDRMDGGTRSVAGLLTFDMRRGEYSERYQVGRLVGGGEEFKLLGDGERPRWATGGQQQC